MENGDSLHGFLEALCRAGVLRWLSYAGLQGIRPLGTDELAKRYACYSAGQNQVDAEGIANWLYILLVDFPG